MSKIAICFLITEKINVKDVWSRWLYNGNFDAYAHVSRGNNECLEWIHRNNITLIDEISTAWAAPSVTSAMFNLYDKAFENNEFCCLVSQDMIPLLSNDEFHNFLSNGPKVSYIDNVDKYWWDNDKVEIELREKYNVSCGSQFSILHIDGWKIIKNNWNLYFEEFASIYTEKRSCEIAHYSLDEVFIQSMISMFKLPVIYRNISHEEYCELQRATQADINKIDKVVSSDRYLMSRKYVDSPLLINILTDLKILNVTNTIQITTWNVLADIWMEPSHYPVINEEDRLNNIISTINRLKSDIFCLQEIQSSFRKVLYDKFNDCYTISEIIENKRDYWRDHLVDGKTYESNGMIFMISKKFIKLYDFIPDFKHIEISDDGCVCSYFDIK